MQIDRDRHLLKNMRTWSAALVEAFKGIYKEPLKNQPTGKPWPEGTKQSLGHSGGLWNIELPTGEKLQIHISDNVSREPLPEIPLRWFPVVEIETRQVLLLPRLQLQLWQGHMEPEELDELLIPDLDLVRLGTLDIAPMLPLKAIALMLLVKMPTPMGYGTRAEAQTFRQALMRTCAEHTI